MPEFAILRYRSQAEKFKRVDPPQVYAVLGVLSAAIGDLAAMHENHQKAIAASGESATQLYNYACTLRRCNLLPQALKFSQGAVAKAPEDVGFLETLISILYRYKKIDDLLECFKKYRDFTSKAHPLELVLIEDGTLAAYAELLEDIEAGNVSPQYVEMFKEMLLDTHEDLALLCASTTLNAGTA